MEKIKSTLILCYGYVALYAPKELVLSRIEADILKNIFQYFNTKVSCWDAPSSPGRESTPGRAGAARLFWVLCLKGLAGTLRQPLGEGHSLRRLHARALLTCLVFSLVQVLGIKVETKVQCEALNLNCSLLFPAASVCLLPWVPLESSPVLCSQQRFSAHGHRESCGSCCSSPRAPQPGPLCWNRCLKVPKLTAEGKGKMPFWQDREP